MKIADIPIKHTYKPARIISDVLSLAVAAVIITATVNFFPLYKDTINKLGNTDLQFVIKYGYSLVYRRYFALAFPIAVGIIFAVYLILVLKNHGMKRLKITKDNAQAVGEWYMFSASLCKLPLLMIVFELMYMTQQILLFKPAGLPIVQLLLYSMLFIIIIRMSMHRLSSLTKAVIPETQNYGGVKARLADDIDNEEEKGE